MAEIEPNVYDIVYPSPVTLQEISSIAVAVQIWLSELKQYGGNNVMEKIHPEGKSNQNISFPDVISNLPSTIDCMIKKYHKIFVASIHQWLEYNFKYIFGMHRENLNDILKDFNDVACDFNGTVHYDRTAKRMLHCDRISQEEKFMIACSHCFENVVRENFLSVECKIDLNQIDCDQYPHLFYWMCRIGSEIYEIPDDPDEGDYPMDEMMLAYDTNSRSTFEFFWNRLSLEKQSELAFDYCLKGTPAGLYSKFILPKLSEQQISQILDTEKIDYWFYIMFKSDQGSREYILPIWMCIKNYMEETTFNKLAKSLVGMENWLYIADASTEQASDNDEKLTLCCDLWNSAPDHLKRAAIKYIFDDGRLLKSNWKLSQYREIRFLLVVLSDATLEERLIFWRNSWLNLLKLTRRTDFLKIMKLCLNEEQIGQFKETTMSNYKNIKKVIEKYFKNENFKELRDLVNLCCPDQKSRRIWYREILHSDFFTIYDISDENYIIRKLKPKLEFIEDVYAEDPDLSAHFNTDVLSPLLFDISMRIVFLSLIEVAHFFDRISSFIQNFDEFKKERLLEMVRCYISSGPIYRFNAEEIRKFLFWCLGKEDENEMIKFKQSISPDQVVRNMLRNVKRSLDNEVDADSYELMIEYPPTLDSFLSWYFATPQELNEFKTRLADVFKWFKPPVRNFFFD